MVFGPVQIHQKTFFEFFSSISCGLCTGTKIEPFLEIRPKSKKYGTRILNLTMENLKKFTHSRSDITSRRYKSLKIYS